MRARSPPWPSPPTAGWSPAGGDETARVWDLKNPTAAPLVLRGHEGSIIALAFAPDGRLVTGRR